jgi:hypothetical protein
MDIYTATEQAYKHGYEKGYAAGKKDATDNNVGYKWIPVSERLPEKAIDYLCRCCIDGHTDFPFHMVLRYILFDKNPHFQHESVYGLNVTHWVPIPEPPKEG